MPSQIDPVLILTLAMEVARASASAHVQLGNDDIAVTDYHDVAEALQGIGTLDPNRDQDLELRNAIAEGMLDALSGLIYNDEYAGDEAHATNLALAYCGGYCLIAPGYDHAGAVQLIVETRSRLETLDTFESLSYEEQAALIQGASDLVDEIVLQPHETEQSGS